MLVCTCACVCVFVHVPRRACGVQRIICRTWISPSTTGSVRPSDLAASSLATESTHWPSTWTLWFVSSNEAITKSFKWRLFIHECVCLCVVVVVVCVLQSLCGSQTTAFGSQEKSCHSYTVKPRLECPTLQFVGSFLLHSVVALTAPRRVLAT